MEIQLENPEQSANNRSKRISTPDALKTKISAGLGKVLLTDERSYTCLYKPLKFEIFEKKNRIFAFLVDSSDLGL